MLLTKRTAALVVEELKKRKQFKYKYETWVKNNPIKIKFIKFSSNTIWIIFLSVITAFVLKSLGLSV